MTSKMLHLHLGGGKRPLRPPEKNHPNSPFSGWAIGISPFKGAVTEKQVPQPGQKFRTSLFQDYTPLLKRGIQLSPLIKHGSPPRSLLEKTVDSLFLETADKRKKTGSSFE